MVKWKGAEKKARSVETDIKLELTFRSIQVNKKNRKLSNLMWQLSYLKDNLP